MFPLNPYKIREKYGLKPPILIQQQQPIQQPIQQQTQQQQHQNQQQESFSQNIQLKITPKIPIETSTTTQSLITTQPPTTTQPPIQLQQNQIQIQTQNQNQQLSSDILTEESPKIQPIANIKISLKDHQRSLVRRCLNIEKSYINTPTENYGILSDKPGAGKTYVVLSLL